MVSEHFHAVITSCLPSIIRFVPESHFPIVLHLVKADLSSGTQAEFSLLSGVNLVLLGKTLSRQWSSSWDVYSQV